MPQITVATFDVEKMQLPPQEAIKPLDFSQVKIGAGNDAVVIDKTGIFAGAKSPSDALFNITSAGSFIYRSSLSQSTVSGFDNGEQIVNQVKVTNLDGKNLLPIVERVVYVGSRDAANILAGGSSIDESQFQLFGDTYSHVDTNGANVGINEVVNWRYIRNISAGTVTLYIDVYVRYLVNTGIAS